MSGLELIRDVARQALGAIERLAEELLPGGHVEGQWWCACDPTRPDRHPSLKLSLRDGGWKDWSRDGVQGSDLVALAAHVRGCSQIEAARWLQEWLGTAPREPARPAVRRGSSRDEHLAEWELADPVPVAAPAYGPQLRHRRYGDAQAHWEYRDQHGQLILVVVRWWDAAAAKKEIRQLSCWRHRETGELRWHMRWGRDPRPLYGLDRLAAAPHAPVLVVEGEKAADAAQRMLGDQAVAVTCPGGAENASRAEWSALSGREVLIWPDHDPAGSKAAAAIQRQVRQARVLDPVAIWRSRGEGGAPPAKWDAADMDPGAVLPWVDLVATLPPPDPQPAETAAPAGAERPETAAPVDAEETPQEKANKRAAAYAWKRRKLEEYLAAEGLDVDALGQWRQAGVACEWEPGIIKLRFLDHCRSQGWQVGKEFAGDLQVVLADAMMRQRRQHLIDTVAAAPRTEYGEAALRAWVVAVVGTDCELWLAVMRHWAWLCKRRFLARPVEHEIMPILFGKQGGGKSEAVRRLLQPWAELAIDGIGVDQFQDERKARTLARSAIGFWDEMQGAARSDIQALKHCVTANTISYRPMATNDHVQLPRRCSFIGASNDPVRSIISDTTGARRWVEIPCLDRCDWSAINEIEPQAWWECVSVDDPAPILPVLPQLREHQAALVHEDAYALWLEAEEWDLLKRWHADAQEPQVIPAYDPQHGCAFTDIAGRFAHWCHRVGQTPLGGKMLAQRLHQAGFLQRTITVSGRRARRWFVPAELLQRDAVPVAETSEEAADAIGW